MANTLTATLTQILAKGMMGLREQVLMTRLVNTDWSMEAKSKGATIDIPIATDMGTADSVTPAATPTAGDDITTAVKQITLDQWYHKAFNLNDQEIDRINANDNFIPLQMQEAFRTIAYKINSTIYDTAPGIYGYTGTAGTTPFGSGSEVADATNLRKTLHEQLCPRTDRRMVLDFAAEAAALNLAQISDADKRGSGETKMTGDIGRAFGFDMYGDDQVPTHTAGTASGATTDSTGYALGIKTVTLASAGTGTILTGDIITFAGDTQTYAVTSGDADVSGGGSISFVPGLKVVIEASAHAITLKASHVMNLGFHRDAFGLAVRAPEIGTKALFGAETTNNLSNMVTLNDPVTGLVMRIELIRMYKMWMYDIDCLWGVTLVSPERAARLAG